MLLCPIAATVGCRKCPVFAVCPVKGVIGDFKPEPPPEQKAATAKTPATKSGKAKAPAQKSTAAKSPAGRHRRGRRAK